MEPTVEITPEPSDDERAAILAALAEDASPEVDPGPWLDPSGDDQDPGS